jgi:hypothetical protein
MFKKLKEFFIKKLLDENGNPSFLAKILCLAIFVIIIVVIYLNIKLKDNNEFFINKDNIEAETKDEILQVEEERELMDRIISSVVNVNNIDTATLESQIKFLSLVDGTYNDLITISYVGNVQSLNNRTNLRGLFDLKIASFDISLEAPIFINDLESDKYSIYVDIPSAYKPSFNMSQEQSYLYTDKNHVAIINEKYNLFEQAD